MNEFDLRVLHAFWFIGYLAGILACIMIVLVGIVSAFQMVWWIVRQTEAWIRVRNVVLRYQRLHDRMRSNAEGLRSADRQRADDKQQPIVGGPK